MAKLSRLLMSFVLLPITHIALAADDATSRAMALYEKHHYAEAAKILLPELAKLSGEGRASANLVMGMVYLGNALLHREMYQAALVIEKDYLTQLAKQRNSMPSKYVDLYLGQVLMETGRLQESEARLRKFAAQKTVSATGKSWAQIELGLLFNRQGQLQKATGNWAAVSGAKPEELAGLAGAYALANMREKAPAELADSALRDAQAHGIPVTGRMVRNILRAYAHSGAYLKAIELLDKFEADMASQIEELGESKTIRFYDASLMDDMSAVYLQAAISYLETAGKEERLSGTASFYLQKAYLIQGNAKKSQYYGEKVLGKTRLPAQIESTAKLARIQAVLIEGRRSEATAMLMQEANRAAGDPVGLAGILQVCADTGMDCGNVEKAVLPMLEKGEGKKYFALSSALGRYYLKQKKYVQGHQFLEGGRDKSNKNKIEFNDPLMLVSLAEACYQIKKYSENLEIFFELSKEYPVVRQIQDAMQGIYAMEQQSAGEVKIF